MLLIAEVVVVVEAAEAEADTLPCSLRKGVEEKEVEDAVALVAPVADDAASVEKRKGKNCGASILVVVEVEEEEEGEGEGEEEEES